MLLTLEQWGPQRRGAHNWALSLEGYPISPFPHFYRVQRHPFERIATPFQVYSWTAPQAEHAMDCVRAEDAYTSRLGYEEHIPGQVLPGPTLPASPPGARFLLCTSRRLPPVSVGLSAGRWKEKGIVRSGHMLSLHLPPWPLHRPGTGMKSCRQQGSCPARTCLSGCFEKEPYSR